MVNDKLTSQNTWARSAKSSTSTIEEYPLEKRKITKKITAAMIFWTIFLGIGLVISIILANTMSGYFWYLTLFLIVLWVIIFIIQLWYQNEYFKRYFYDIEADFLKIKKGVIMPHETMLPYEKLQDVYMDQDLLDRMFGLWDVHVSTATAMSGYEAHIDGVNHENAEKLRELILNKIRKEKK